MNYENYELINSNGYLKTSRINDLREKFIINFCDNMGWNKDNLTIEQLEQIKKYKEYKNPELLLS